MEGTTLKEAFYPAANPGDPAALSFDLILWVNSSKPQLERKKGNREASQS
jgi:hypothetical protein